jgi:hypothetical protein
LFSALFFPVAFELCGRTFRQLAINLTFREGASLAGVNPYSGQCLSVCEGQYRITCLLHTVVTVRLLTAVGIPKFDSCCIAVFCCENVIVSYVYEAPQCRKITVYQLKCFFCYFCLQSADKQVREYSFIYTYNLLYVILYSSLVDHHFLSHIFSNSCTRQTAKLYNSKICNKKPGRTVAYRSRIRVQFC